MKTIIHTLTLSALLLSFSSCDKESASKSDNRLIGKWQITHHGYYNTEGNVIYETIEDGTDIEFTETTIIYSDKYEYSYTVLSSDQFRRHDQQEVESESVFKYSFNEEMKQNDMIKGWLMSVL